MVFFAVLLIFFFRNINISAFINKKLQLLEDFPPHTPRPAPLLLGLVLLNANDHPLLTDLDGRQVLLCLMLIYVLSFTVVDDKLSVMSRRTGCGWTSHHAGPRQNL